MRIVMMTDLEGAAGVVSFRDQAYAGGKDYPQAKELLTGEVNAAVEGMVGQGVDDVLVVDGHGVGGIVFEKLAPPARLMHGDETFLTPAAKALFREYDATVMIGQHPMSGTREGCLAHTQSDEQIEYYKLNGRLIGETAQWALFCGALGLPLIFLSGDEAACRQAEQLIPGVVTAAVKRGLGLTGAVSLTPTAAQDLIRRRIGQAVRKHRAQPIPPLRWDGPFVLEKCYRSEKFLQPHLKNPLYERIGPRRVQLKSADLMEIIYA